ncbi:MAG: hydrogenase nickel incorporation protein HypB [Bacillota bacterium]
MKVDIVASVLAANDALARQNRDFFREAGIYVINLISSPGSGKTTILERTVDCLRGRLSMGVIEGDVYTRRDADRIEKKGIPAVQINTGGGCHLNAGMVAGALAGLPLMELDLIFIENVGNLVCPAEYDLGEDAKVVVLSVTEGNDKPCKYPSVFRKSGAVIANKVDLLPYTDFQLSEFNSDVLAINPGLTVFPLSARDGKGFGAWCDWIVRMTAGKS